MSCSEQAKLVIVNREQWSELRSAWADLHAQSGVPTLFLSLPWMDAWLSIFGQQLDVHFVCLKHTNKIVGLTLLGVRHRRRGPFRVKELHLNTAGEGIDSPSVEFNQILCEPDFATLFHRELKVYLASQRWDEIHQNGMIHADDSMLPIEHCLVDRAVDRNSPFVEISSFRGCAQRYLASRSSNTRYQIRRSLKRYEAQGTVVLRESESLDDTLAMFREMIDMHQRAWTARDQRGAFASDATIRFHEHLIRAAYPQGQVRLWKICSGQHVIGILYLFCFDGRLAYYQSGLNYEQDKHLKPGLTCHTVAITHAIEAGFLEYDFLAAGNDGARYKTSLSNASRTLTWTRHKRKNLKNAALNQISAIKKALAP